MAKKIKPFRLWPRTRAQQRHYDCFESAYSHLHHPMVVIDETEQDRINLAWCEYADRLRGGFPQATDSHLAFLWKRHLVDRANRSSLFIVSFALGIPIKQQEGHPYEVKMTEPEPLAPEYTIVGFTLGGKG